MPADPKNSGIMATLWDTLKGKPKKVEMMPDKLDEYVDRKGKKKPCPPEMVSTSK